MRKNLMAGIAAIATLGMASAQADTITFTGTFSSVDNGTIAPGATDPNVGGLNFQISLDYDENEDKLSGASIAIDGNMDGAFDMDDASDMFEFFDATVINAPSGPNNAIDVLDIELASFEGAAAGAHNIRFEFFNTFLDSDSLGDAFEALATADDMAMLICQHFMFNFGGFKYSGELTGNIVIVDDLDPIPVPGAAIFMLSGLAAAGAATARRRRNV